MQAEVSNSPPAPRSHRAAVFFVWAVWAFMLAVNLWVVYRYSPVTIPVSDERQELGGGADFTWAWLWEQHAEHRIPLAKLIWLGTLRLSGYDFRIGNLLEVAAVAGVALALMLAVRRIRGETRWTDAFFPLALLNFGQTYAVFLWWWQVNHTLPPLIACVLLVYLVKAAPQRRDLIPAASLLVLLSLSGPGGLPYVPPLAVWLIWQSILGPRRTSTASRWPYTLALVLTVAAIALATLYFVKFDETMAGKPTPELSTDGIKSSLATTVKLLSVSLGPSTVSNWKIWGLLVALAWLMGFALAAVTFFTTAEERHRAAGLLLFLIGNGTLLLVLGWARANYGDHNTFEGHYLLKGVPALCCVYFICELYAGRRASGEFQAFLLALVLVPGLMLIAKRDIYVDAAERRRRNAETMAQDIDNGRSPYWLYQQYKGFQGADGVDPSTVVSEYQHLRHLGLSSFRNLVREKELPLSG